MSRRVGARAVVRWTRLLFGIAFVPGGLLQGSRVEFYFGPLGVTIGWGRTRLMCPRCDRVGSGSWVTLPYGAIVHAECVRPGDFPEIARWKP